MNSKELGQVWTPAYMVERMLDDIDYQGEHILGKSIMEPSAGNGAFLLSAVRRLHDAAMSVGMSSDAMESMMDACVHGIEYDREAYRGCMNGLHELMSSYHLSVPFSHVICMDALSYHPDTNFDYIVGNPPYRRIVQCSDEIKSEIMSFRFCTGNTDMYIAFFELVLQWVAHDGIITMITPSAWMINASQRYMRTYMMSMKSVVKITDYHDIPVFNEGTYTAVVVMRRPSSSWIDDSFTYVKMNTLSSRGFVSSVPYHDVDDGKSLALPCSPYAADFNDGTAISDEYGVYNGVLTLLDRAFIISDSGFISRNHDCPYLKPVVKAQRYHGGAIDNRIIFPYERSDNGSYIPVDEDELMKYGEVYHHLEGFRDALSKRDVRNIPFWYCYGRTQSIQYTDDRKLIINTFISHDQRTSGHIVPAGTVVYSGIYAIEQGTATLDSLMDIIQGKSFAQYAKIVGHPLAGGYVRIGTTHVKSFRVNGLLVS